MSHLLAVFGSFHRSTGFRSYIPLWENLRDGFLATFDGVEFPLEAGGVVDLLSGILFGSNENWPDLCLNPQTHFGFS